MNDIPVWLIRCRIMASGCKPDRKETIPPTVSFGASSRQGLQPYTVGGFSFTGTPA